MGFLYDLKISDESHTAVFLKAPGLIMARLLFERVRMLQRRASDAKFHNLLEGPFRLEELSSF
jgi:hypothetical protein